MFRGSTEVGFVVAARLPRVERVRRGFVAGARRAGARVRRTQLVGRPSDLVLPSRTTPAGYLSRTLSVVGCQAVFVFAADRDSVLRLGDGILRAEQVP